MKNYIFIFTFILYIINANLAHSQARLISKNSTNDLSTPEYKSDFEDGLAVVGFRKNNDKSNVLLYGIIDLSTDLNKKNEYLIPPVLNHVRFYNDGGIKMVDFEINNKWFKGILASDIKNEFKKVFGKYPADYYIDIVRTDKEEEERKLFEKNLGSNISNADAKDELWIKFWKEIYINNKDLFLKRGEFEKSNDYEKRLTAQQDLKKNSYVEFFKIRSSMESDLKNKEENIKIAKISESIKRYDFSINMIDNYDADNETFNIEIYGEKSTSEFSMKKYVGSFTLSGAEIKTYIKENALYIFIPGQSEYELLFNGTNKFDFKKISGYSVVFNLNKNNELLNLSIHQPNGNFKAQYLKKNFTSNNVSKDKIIFQKKIHIPIDQAPDFKSNYTRVKIDAIQLLDFNLNELRFTNFEARFDNKLYQIGEQEDLSKYNSTFTSNSNFITSKITSLPKLNTSLIFQDENENNILDGDEKSFIKLFVKNDGLGLAQGVTIKTIVDNTLALEYKTDNYIGTIEPNSEKTVTIPIRGLENLTTGTRTFRIVVNETNGFNPPPTELIVSTKELIKPTLILSDFGIENTLSKLPILKQSETSKVTFRVQNNSKADAKNILFNIKMPNNIYLISGNKSLLIPEIKAGSILDIPIDIAPNSLSKNFEEIKLIYSGKYLTGDFSKNLSIESNSVASNKVVISGKEETSSNYNEVITADLNIDIENNIPLNKNINKNTIAVVLGIEKYKNVGNVSFASRDASIVKEYFNKALGIPLENIYYKINGDVTKGEMEKIFGGWIKNRVDTNTSVYIYYAGHGAPSTDQNAYLIPNDGDPNYAEETGYSLNKMYDQLGKLPTDKITVFLDACFSGQDREQKLLIKDARGLGIKTKTSAIPDKLNVFSASSNDQVSSGWPDKKHGLFTYFMLKGIQGSADNNKDKQVSYEELSNYIKLNVERQAGFLDRKQNPQSKIVNLNSKIN